MRQLIGTSDGVRLVRLPAPAVGPKDILVRVQYSLVSTGTETAPYKAMLNAAEQPLLNRFGSKVSTAARYARLSLQYPDKAVERLSLMAKKRLSNVLPTTDSGTSAPSDLFDQGWSLGYSCAGEVIAIGDDVSDLKVGDRVACAGAGVANHAEMVCAPRNLVAVIPEGVGSDVAAMTTVASIALNGVRRASPNIGDVVVVIGLGLIGQMTVQMLVANGCKVIGYDPVEGRVERAKSLGMHDGTDDVGAMNSLIGSYTGGWGADAVIITASTTGSGPVKMATEAARRRGVVVLVGDVGLQFERQAFYVKELDVRMSTSYGPGRYDLEYEKNGRDYPLPYVRWTLNRNMGACLDMMSQGQLKLDELIDEKIAIADAPKAYQRLAAGGDDVPIGVLLEYAGGADVVGKGGRLDLRSSPGDARDGAHGIALVGVGAFGVSMLLPLFEQRAPDVELRAVVSSDPLRGGNFARQRQLPTVATDVRDLLDDDSINVFVIASKHNLHAPQVIACLKAGRHVFVEKPLAIDWASLAEVQEAYAALEAPPLLMVGFNRRFSPACMKLRALLSKRQGPITMSYRVNAGYIPREHWIQGAEGGGRNIGEACHMYDTMRSLTGAAVESVSADAIAPADASTLRSDNFSVALRFQDGSLGQLLYTASGPKAGMAKERLEVFCDGEAYILDDFKSLTRVSTGEIIWSAREADKGHAQEVSAFLDSLVLGGTPPIPADELFEVTGVALLVEDLIHDRLVD